MLLNPRHYLIGQGIIFVELMNVGEIRLMHKEIHGGIEVANLTITLKYGSNSEEKLGIRIIKGSGVFSSLLNERTTCLE